MDTLTTKDSLLHLLETNRNRFISGEEAAASLGISRSAIWKAISVLRKEGFSILARPGSGYQLIQGSDTLSVQGVRAYLPNHTIPIQVWEETQSTNGLAKQWALEGAPHGAMVLAQQQTGGRGRLGRSFASPAGGLYMSVVLRPSLQMMEDASLVTSAAAVAVCEAVQELCGLSLSIKWVNDLFYGDKKCCGILTEGGTGFEAGTIEYMVVGIGLNYATPAGSFPPELAAIAGSLYPEGAAPVPRVQLAALIYTKLVAYFNTLPQRAFLPEYRKRSLLLGKDIQVLTNPPYFAKALSIDEDARLVVEREDKTVVSLFSGEVSVRI